MQREAVLEAIDGQLSLLARRATAPLRSVVEYALGGGKRMRGLLLVAVGEAFAVPLPELLRAAAALELLHAATLVQDDIFDESCMRRGRPAVHYAFDVRLATLASDWMLAEAIRVAYRLRPALGEALSESAERMIAGEACELAALPAVTPAAARTHTLMVARAKTGELFGIAASAGALLAGEPTRARELHRLGSDLGLAFQYADDVLDLYGQEAAAGKILFRDLKAQLRTLPVLDACALFPLGFTEALMDGRIGLVEHTLEEPEVRHYLLTRAARFWYEASRALPQAIPQGAAAQAVVILLESYAPGFPLRPASVAAPSAA